MEQLKPTKKPRVMDLVAEAGIDVSPWQFRKDGGRVPNPAANPHYCYEWCFADERTIVLSVWFDHMLLEDGRVLQRVNMRDLRRRIDRANHLDAGTRTRNARRAIAVDSAVQRAFRTGMSIRVIICDGDIRDIDDPASRDPSSVERRLLDPSPWHVVEYEYRGTTSAGATVLVRDQALNASGLT